MTGEMGQNTGLPVLSVLLCAGRYNGYKTVEFGRANVYTGLCMLYISFIDKFIGDVEKTIQKWRLR